MFQILDVDIQIQDLASKSNMFQKTNKHLLSKNALLRPKALFFCARRPPAVFFAPKEHLLSKQHTFCYKSPCSYVRGGLRRFFFTRKEHCLSKTHTSMTNNPVLRCAAASGGFFSPNKGIV